MLAQSIEEAKTDTNQSSSGGLKEIIFEFIESDLVTAIRNGYWVVLDNVNSRY